MTKEEVKTEVPETKKKSEEFELTEITTETAQVFKSPEGEILNHNQMLVWIANNILAIKRSVA